MHNINLFNHDQASDFDINRITEFLLTKVIERVNEQGRIVDSHLTDFVVTKEGFVVIHGNCDDMFQVYDAVNAVEGTSILRCKVLLNLTTHKYDAIIKKIPETTSWLSKHILSASIEHNGDFTYYAKTYRFRGKDI